MAKQTFSQKMNNWLKSAGPKNFGELERAFEEKSFAVAFLILMAPAALPIPTGGITHIFEIITMLLAVEMIVGRKSLWLPAKWRQRNLGKTLEKKALPKLITFVNWFEKRSQKRLSSLLDNGWFLRFVGLLIFLLALASLLAVPFSGLDTLPALGIVVISLGLILEDFLVFIFGIGFGIAGVILEISLGSAALHLFTRL